MHLHSLVKYYYVRMTVHLELYANSLRHIYGFFTRRIFLITYHSYLEPVTGARTLNKTRFARLVIRYRNRNVHITSRTCNLCA